MVRRRRVLRCNVYGTSSPLISIERVSRDNRARAGSRTAIESCTSFGREYFARDFVVAGVTRWWRRGRVELPVQKVFRQSFYVCSRWLLIPLPDDANGVRHRSRLPVTFGRATGIAHPHLRFSVPDKCR